MVEVTVDQTSGLFDVTDEPLFLETDLEASTPVGSGPTERGGGRWRRSRYTGMYSPAYRKVEKALDEIEGRPQIVRKMRKYLWNPIESLPAAGYDFLDTQFRAHGLILEAEVLTAMFNGFFGRTPSGMPATNFTALDGNPGFVAQALDDSGLVQLRRRTLSNGEILTYAAMAKSENALDKFHDVNPAGADRFLKLLYQRGDELNNILKVRYPGLNANGDGYRIIIDRMGKRIGEELQHAIDSDGIRADGSVFYEGKMYNLTSTGGVELFVEKVLRDKFPLVTIDEQGKPHAKPGNRVADATGSRAAGIENGRHT